jgi:dihydroorotase
MASRSRNTPYAGRKLTGRVRHTILAGEPVVRDGLAQR